MSVTLDDQQFADVKECVELLRKLVGKFTEKLNHTNGTCFYCKGVLNHHDGCAYVPAKALLDRIKLPDMPPVAAFGMPITDEYPRPEL
jgi:hypothetical protein